MKTYIEEHELLRRKLWADVWAAVANANDCKSPETATKYADAALSAFDIKFRQPAGSAQ